MIIAYVNSEIPSEYIFCDKKLNNLRVKRLGKWTFHTSEHSVISTWSCAATRALVSLTSGCSSLGVRRLYVAY